MRSLYEIDKRLMEYREEFDEDGVWINEAELDDLNMERNERIEQHLLWSKNIDAEAEMVKRERDNLNERYQALVKRSDRIKDHIARELNGEKFSTPRVATLWRKSSSVRIIDEYLIPDKFCNVHIERKPDKTMIKKALKEGREVTGAVLEEKNNLTIK